jgi:retinol dehydrogenase-12
VPFTLPFHPRPSRLTAEVGTSGIGRATCEALVECNPTHIFLLSRNTYDGVAIAEQIQTTAPDILISFIPCDLSSFTEIRRAVSDFALLSSRLDLLFCNSALCMVPANLTQDGYEIQFGVNHLGHALLIKLLMPTLLQTAAQEPEDVRIIMVSSRAHSWAPKEGIRFDDLETEQRRLTTKERYGQSKLANLLYARELALKYPAIKTVSVYPGVADTNLMSHRSKKSMRYDRVVRAVTNLFNRICRRSGKELLTPAEGARALVWCAMAPTADVTSGEYYDPGGALGQCSAKGRDMYLATSLWDWTQSIVEKVPMERRFISEDT